MHDLDVRRCIANKGCEFCLMVARGMQGANGGSKSRPLAAKRRTREGHRTKCLNRGHGSGINILDYFLASHPSWQRLALGFYVRTRHRDECRCVWDGL